MKTNSIISLIVLFTGGFSLAFEVTSAAQRLMGIETVELSAKSLPLEVAVYGSVLSPAPVIELLRQIAATQAAVKMTKESLDRVTKLFASGELVARKDVQTAEMQYTQDQTALQLLEDRMILEWGQRFSQMTTVERTKQLDYLLAGREALIRLSGVRGDRGESAPLAARLHLFGHQQTLLRCSKIMPASAIDPAFQTPAWIGLMETPTTPLAFGQVLTGFLELRGAPRDGVFVPESAVVFYLGKAWIYQKQSEVKFVRIEVPIDNPVEGGWFVAVGVLEPNLIVTQAAQVLLSKETLVPTVGID